jgi:hypothetical protein
MNAQNLQSSVECAGQLEPLVKDRNHEVGAHRDPDLGHSHLKCGRDGLQSAVYQAESVIRDGIPGFTPGRWCQLDRSSFSLPLK